MISVTFLLAFTVAVQPVQAKPKFKVLHTFHGKDGANPVGVLIRDNAGNLYGTTGIGGTGKCQFGCGTVFKLNSAGKEIWLHSFNQPNGNTPVAGLLRDPSGNLLGTTLYGGVTNKNCGGAQGDGCGLVFGLDKTGTRETVLYKFKGGHDGLFPEALLVQDKAGNLYGTTYVGDGLGNVFKVAPDGKETVLYTFTGGSDGCGPYPGVILDADGNLYGAASGGGDAFCNNGHGVIFEVDTTGNLKVLHTFTGADGAAPDSVLLFDSAGNLYGTTVYGGNSSGCGSSGCGTVFKVSPQSGGNWSESVLYSFCSLSNCIDGAEPDRGPLVRDSAGNLYGTAYFGGDKNLCNGSCGVVFKLDTAGNETVLHPFTGGKDGAFPFAGLVTDGHGNYYGTTQAGGSACYGSNTCGVVFEVTP